jgi:hypothetical protein
MFIYDVSKTFLLPTFIDLSCCLDVHSREYTYNLLVAKMKNNVLSLKSGP